MAQPFAELSNPGGGTNPLTGRPRFGQPGTPVHYDPEVDALIDYGPGTKCQLPHSDFAKVIVRGWQWVAGTASIGITITPQVMFGTGGVSAGPPVAVPVSFTFGLGTPPTPGEDETMGGTYPLNRVYDAYAVDGLYYQIGSYSDLEATGGIDSLYVAPKVTIALGKDTIFTLGLAKDTADPEADAVYYRNDDVEFTVEWIVLVSGPGLPDNVPPIPPIPVQVGSAGAPDSGDLVKPPQILTTIFLLDDAYTDEEDVTVADSVASTTEGHLPKIRVMGDLSSSSECDITAPATLSITAYAHERAGI